MLFDGQRSLGSIRERLTMLSIKKSIIFLHVFGSYHVVQASRLSAPRGLPGTRKRPYHDTHRQISHHSDRVASCAEISSSFEHQKKKAREQALLFTEKKHGAASLSIPWRRWLSAFSRVSFVMINKLLMWMSWGHVSKVSSRKSLQRPRLLLLLRKKAGSNRWGHTDAEQSNNMSVLCYYWQWLVSLCLRLFLGKKEEEERKTQAWWNRFASIDRGIRTKQSCSSKKTSETLMMMMTRRLTKVDRGELQMNLTMLGALEIDPEFFRPALLQRTESNVCMTKAMVNTNLSIHDLKVEWVGRIGARKFKALQVLDIFMTVTVLRLVMNTADRQIHICTINALHRNKCASFVNSDERFSVRFLEKRKEADKEEALNES
jgi:hypothetical protein